MSLPETAQGPVRFDDGEHRVELELVEAGQRGEVGAARARSVPARAAGAAASYPEVFEGVEMVWTALPGGVKEELILADVDAPREFTWRLSASAGVEARLTPEDAVELTDTDGALVAVVPPPFMFETGRAAEEELSSDIAVDLEADGDGWRYRMRLDEAWLDDLDRSWPVTVDPTIVTTPLTDCMIYENSSMTAARTRCGWARPRRAVSAAR